MLSQFYPPVVGGQERHVHTLAHELVRRGHEVDVTTIACRPGDVGTVEEGGVRVHRVVSSASRLPSLYRDLERPHALPVPDPALGRAIASLLAGGSPPVDVVHAHDWAVNSALGPARRAGVPVVLTMHDYSHACATKRLVREEKVCPGPRWGDCLACARRQHTSALGAGVAVANRHGRRRRDRAVAAFLPVSSAVARHTMLEEGTYEVVPNFIPDDLVGAAEGPHPHGPIVFVGDLSRDKGVEVLLEAHRRMAHPPELLLAGRTFEDVPLELSPGARTLGLLPHAEVRALMASASVVAVPSIVADCCPTVVLEAMAAARPVVGAASGGIVDLVADGETGVLVAPGDADDLARALERLGTDPARAAAMGQAGHERVRRFTASPVVERIEAVYERVAGRSDEAPAEHLGRKARP